MLPKKDGWTVLEQLRERGKQTHVLILTAKDQLADRIKGFQLGTDDYLVKPFAFEELLAHMAALIRRKYNCKSPVIRVADLEIDRNTRLVHRAGQRINLSARELSLLEFLRCGQAAWSARGDLGTCLRFFLDPRQQRDRRLYPAAAAQAGAHRLAAFDPYAPRPGLRFGRRITMRSLRSALVLGTSIGTGLVFSAAGILLYFFLRKPGKSSGPRAPGKSSLDGFERRTAGNET